MQNNKELGKPLVFMAHVIITYFWVPSTNIVACGASLWR